MAYSLNFDETLRKTLAELAPEYTWEAGWVADERSRVDVAGLNGKIPRVLVEVELKKDNPVENVVKIWRWAARSKKRKTIVFFHAFSALYHRPAAKSAPPKTKQYERAVFVGQRMRQERKTLGIEYRDLAIFTTTRKKQPIPFTPRMRRGSITKKCGSSMHRAAEELAKTIARLLHHNSRQ